MIQYKNPIYEYAIPDPICHWLNSLNLPIDGFNDYKMSITTSELIQLLQLIILAFTAVILISQFIVRFFHQESMSELLISTGENQMIDRFRNGVKLFYLSILFFMIGGSVVSLSLVLSGAPEVVDGLIGTVQDYLRLVLGLVLLMLGAIAMWIRGDYENPHAGIKGVVIAAVLTGGISIMILLIYITLWAASRGPEWVFFIGATSVAFAMFTLLFGAVALGEVFLKIIEKSPNSNSQ